MRRISNKPITEATVLDSLNREIVPAIRGIQSAVIAIDGTDLAAIDSRLDAVEADIELIELDVAAVEGDVAAVELDVADHETRIADLEGEIIAAKVTWFSGRNPALGSNISATYYHQPYGASQAGVGTSITTFQFLVSRPGTIKNLRYQNLAPNADTDTFDFMLNVNGSDTALEITGLSPSTVGVEANTVDSVAVAAEDLIVFKQLNDAGSLTGSTQPVWSYDFEEDP